MHQVPFRRKKRCRHFPRQRCSHGCVNSTVSKNGRRVALVVRQSSDGIGNGFTSRLALSTSMSQQYLRGSICWEGQKLLASLMNMVLVFERHGSRFTPQAHRALNGWRRLTQPTSSSRENSEGGGVHFCHAGGAANGLLF